MYETTTCSSRKGKEVKEQSGPLLGIVTDALHFIFIRLLPDKTFVFESECFDKTPSSPGPDEDGIKVHTANTWDDLDSIATFIIGSYRQMKYMKRGNITFCYNLVN